jgi:hypothetical protein
MSRQSEFSEPYRQPTPCERCDYVFDRGRTGARMCPTCMVADLDALDRFCLATAPALHAHIERERQLDALIGRVRAWFESRPTSTSN